METSTNPPEEVVFGTVVSAPDFDPTPVEILVQSDTIVEIGETRDPRAARTIILPLFVNAHAHLADSILKDPSVSSLDELVKPPDGLKHRRLRESPEKELVMATRRSLRDALRCGTGVIADFREGGTRGLRQLEQATSGQVGPRVVALGRPDHPSLDDLPAVLEGADGVGVSGANDMLPHVLEEISAITRRKGKFLAVHAGEKDDSDVDAALSLDPDLLVHMTHATPEQLRTVADRGIPVVVCPRSNLLLGVGRAPNRPPVQRMLDLGITLCLGTDNVMLNSLDMFAEMEFLRKAYDLSDRDVLRASTVSGAKALKMDSVIGTVETGKTGCLMILDAESDNLRGPGDPVARVVRRARPSDVRAVKPIHSNWVQV